MNYNVACRKGNLHSQRKSCKETARLCGVKKLFSGTDLKKILIRRLPVKNTCIELRLMICSLTFFFFLHISFLHFQVHRDSFLFGRAF